MIYWHKVQRWQKGKRHLNLKYFKTKLLEHQPPLQFHSTGSTYNMLLQKILFIISGQYQWYDSCNSSIMLFFLKLLMQTNISSLNSAANSDRICRGFIKFGYIWNQLSLAGTFSQWEFWITKQTQNGNECEIVAKQNVIC